jgi:MFS family permease
MISTAAPEGPRLRASRLTRLPVYYGLVNLAVAALAMTATLPGRTHGLGLITKPLTEDSALGVSESHFSVLNFWAILLGAALCLPTGRWIDRWGARAMLVGVVVGLGATVLWMSQAAGVVVLFVSLTLVRGLGQGALSVVSTALVGKWFTRRLGVAMGVFTVLLAFGFIVSFLVVGQAVKEFGWRPAWGAVGWALVLGLAPLGALLVRSTPEAVGLGVDQSPGAPARPAPLDLPLPVALRAPAFWTFTLAAALFNLMWSAITLFNESLLARRGVGHDTFVLAMGVLTAAGLPANLLGGWLAGRWSIGKVLALGMLALAGALAFFPLVQTAGQALAYAGALGAAGGVVTVVYFSAYGYAFGRTHLGIIQGVVQVLMVVASALGPWLLTTCWDVTGSSAPLFLTAAVLAAGSAVSAWVVRLPATRAELVPAA